MKPHERIRAAAGDYSNTQVGGDCVSFNDCYSGSGGGGGGEDFTEPVEDPCSKIKGNFSNTTFKEKFNNLTDPSVFNLENEKGTIERYPPKDSGLQPGFADIQNQKGTTNMDLPENRDGIVGLMHSHNNEDRNGNHPIKIFSPTDIRTFINILMPQSNGYTGSYTNAYSIVTTSAGNYMLKYTKETWPGSIDYATWKNWGKWYDKQFSNLLDNGELTQANVEKLFTKMLQEVIKIDGLELYKITQDSAAKLEYNSDNQPVKSTNCQ